MGGWAVAQSPILGTTITLERLRKRGYEAVLTHYEKVAPHLNEPLYTSVHRSGAFHYSHKLQSCYSLPNPNCHCFCDTNS